MSKYLGQVIKSLPPVQAYFGLNYRNIPCGAVLSGLPPGGKLGPAGGGMVMLTNPSDPTRLEVENVAETVEFTVGLDLRQLPATWQNPTMLGQRLQVSLPGTTPRIVPGSVQMLNVAQRTAPATPSSMPICASCWPRVS